VPAADSIIGRLAQTPRELAGALEGRADHELSRRPDAQNWSATEIVCHLRDVEELFQVRFHTILAVHEPPIFVLGASASELMPWRVGGAIGHPLDPVRWAEERQYVRNDPHEARAAFARRREEVLTLLRSLSAKDWQRIGVHPARGRLTLRDWVASLAAHDDNHLDQLRRALDGRP
jgi:hypothetical protein